jgi:hypothetical protein
VIGGTGILALASISHWNLVSAMNYGRRATFSTKRFLSFQAGFRYISNLANGVPYLEHR